MRNPQKFIFHVDLDCFFAAVYLLDHPEHKGLPIIVGADPKKGKGRGVVSTCSYEAREYGVHSAMPISQAYRLCPRGIYVKVDFSKIRQISQQVMSLLEAVSDILEQTSIDEAYLDCTAICTNFKQAYNIAFNLKERIKNETGVTCSIGVSFSKTLAKIGSDYNKPDGVTIITQENYQDLLKNLKITRIPGIGKKSKQYYHKRGYFTLGDFYQRELSVIRSHLGKNGVWAWRAAHGLDQREVHKHTQVHAPKSISKERTFGEDVSDFDQILQKIEDLNLKIHAKMEKKDLFYRTISIKIRFQGFETFTRAHSFNTPIRNQETALETARSLLNEFQKNNKKIRLIGLRFSNFSPTLPSVQTKITEFLK